MTATRISLWLQAMILAALTALMVSKSPVSIVVNVHGQSINVTAPRSGRGEEAQDKQAKHPHSHAGLPEPVSVEKGQADLMQVKSRCQEAQHDERQSNAHKNLSGDTSHFVSPRSIPSTYSPTTHSVKGGGWSRPCGLPRNRRGESRARYVENKVSRLNEFTQ